MPTLIVHHPIHAHTTKSLGHPQTTRWQTRTQKIPRGTVSFDLLNKPPHLTTQHIPNRCSANPNKEKKRKNSLIPSPLVKRINIYNQSTPPNPPTDTSSNGIHTNTSETYHAPSLPPISKIYRAGSRRTLPKRTLTLHTPGPAPTNKINTLSPPSSPSQY